MPRQTKLSLMTESGVCHLTLFVSSNFSPLSLESEDHDRMFLV
jgi:hypothetical protein